jgi:galactokinase/mevalonate kinase-like predicted kinase
MIAANAVVPARAALAGNPSDGYGGAVLAVTIEEFGARVRASRAPGLVVTPESVLVEATVRRFARDLEPAALATATHWSTSIPRCVGLGGSSAIVIATLKALCTLHSVQLPEATLATLALAVETEELGITAGLQDRVAQAYGGLTFMDFGEPHRYERLDHRMLPPLVVAWRSHAAEDSGSVHDDLRARFDRGEATTRAAMAQLASLARSARDAVLAGDPYELAACVDGSFDARQSMISLDPRHVEMIEVARSGGASANYTGSGGAIVAVCEDESHQEAVAKALAAAACGVVLVSERLSRRSNGARTRRLPRRARG